MAFRFIAEDDTKADKNLIVKKWQIFHEVANN